MKLDDHLGAASYFGSPAEALRSSVSADHGSSIPHCLPSNKLSSSESVAIALSRMVLPCLVSERAVDACCKPLTLMALAL